MVTLIGSAPDYPPADPVGFADFVAGLRDPALAHALAGAEPRSEISKYALDLAFLD